MINKLQGAMLFRMFRGCRRQEAAGGKPTAAETTERPEVNRNKRSHTFSQRPRARTFEEYGPP